ncbi:MAG: hypothetical protein GX564_13375, partial [Oligosphaeraceae bacterium]|nr:hypothetical protein [Oligosphaeraceae bacterium]
MQTFYRATPGHPIWIYWEARNSKRDVLSLLAPEIAMVKSSFQTPRQHDLKLWLSDDHEFSAQNKVLFAEYSWNCNFPGAREFSRDESPVSYPQEWLQLLAMRAATGLWGETYGPRLTALFEDMLSLAYAYDPEGFSTDRTAGTLDLPAFLARNHAALLRAESAAEAVLAETLNNPAQQRLFKGGTYAYFVDLLRMLKAAIIYSSSNQTVQQLLSLARQGELAECQVLHRQASEQLAQQRLSYAEAMEILSQAPAKTDISQHGKWALTASSYRYVSLLQPDFDRLQQHLDQTLASCDSIFTEYSIPSWYRGFCSKYFFKRISCAANDSIWRHFFAFKTFKLAPDPVEFRIRHDHEAIIFSGQIVQTDAQAYCGEAVSFKQWPVGDSACLRILPPGQPDSPVHYQIAVGNSGGACVYRFVTDPGGVTTTSPVDLGLTPEVSRTDDGWSFQLRVPFAALQAQPGKGWKVLFEYNRKDEAFSSVFSDGKYFKDTSFWQDLLFSTFAPP